MIALEGCKCMRDKGKEWKRKAAEVTKENCVY
jgi:hypothetical protein